MLLVKVKMNERIKELAEQAGATFIPARRSGRGSVSEDWDHTNLDVEKFARLIIAECTAQPKVYLLFHKSAMEYDAPDVLHGWTSDLKIAQQWRDSSPRSCGAHRRFENIYFIKRIDSL